MSSVVARIEVERVARRIGGGAIRRARTVMSRIALVELGEEVVRTAASLDPPTLRTLDAIHIATALSLRGELGVVCVYDSRLAAAANSKGIEVAEPS